MEHVPLTRRFDRWIGNVKDGKGLLWAAVLAVLFGVFVYRERAEVFRIFHELRDADPRWVILALVLGLLVQALLGIALGPILRRLRHPVNLIVLARAQIQRHVVSTVVPIGGPAGVYALVRTLNQRDVPTDAALYATLLNGVLGYVSFVIFLIPVLLTLIIEHRLSSLVLIGAAALLVLMAVMIAGLVVLLRVGESDRLRRWLPERISTFIDSARAHGIRPIDLLSPLLIHFGVEIAGVVMLDVCLRAVGEHASLSTILVGYAVGTLFVLVAPVFQGLGAVELSMTVALTGFGIPSGAALAAVILYRAAEVWVPLLAGLSLAAGDNREIRRASAHLPAFVTGLTGILMVLSIVSRPFMARFNRLQEYSFFNAPELSRTFTVIAGFLLIFLSWSLWRRKRVAWLTAIGVLSLSLINHIGKRHDHDVALLAGFNLLLLILHRGRFRVRSDLPTMRQGLIRAALAFVFAIAYGTIGYYLIDRRAFDLDFGLIAALRETLLAFFSLGYGGLEPRTRFGNWFHTSLSIVGVLTVAYATFSLVRPVVWRRRTLPSERRRARHLIEEFGDSSLDFFKLSSDKVFFFSSDHCGVVSYSPALSVAIALGDPVATSPEDFRLVLSQFLDFCDANDWAVAFHQVPPAHLEEYACAGLSALKIGEEAIVELESFSLQGRAMKALRSSINRLDREGYHAEFYPAPQPNDRLARLRAVSDEWLSLSGRRERGFTLGQWDDEYIRWSPVMTVEDSDDQILAFANVIPDGAKGEATIDLMRRRADIPNGIMDFLQVRLMEHFREQGFQRYSLGMAPFSNVGEEPDAPILERAIRLLYDHVSRVFSYKGLYHYKSKFQPIWEPRYLVYSSETALPRIVLGLIQLTERPPAKHANDAAALDQRPPLPVRQPG